MEKHDFINKIIHGDSLSILKQMPDNSVDSVVTDPPYLLEFMGKDWDKANTIDPSFGYWFSGFVDGEGCFRIHRVRNGDYYECHFQLKLRSDDRNTLKEIKKELGFGRIQDNKAEGNSKPTSSYIITSRDDCIKLSELFFVFPLKAKKQRDFFKWYEALINWKNQEKGNRWKGKLDISAMEKNWLEMKELRKYKDSSNPINKDAFFTYLWAKECLRVLKPGGFLLSFGGTRTYHRMTCGIEDAGFEIRDMISWLYGSGFPKSHNVGKAVDKIQGNKRESKGIVKGMGTRPNVLEFADRPIKNKFELTKGNSKWEGWGTALKPAQECIVVARKPLSEKNVALNVLKWGTAGLNIDGCRIPTSENRNRQQKEGPLPSKYGFNKNSMGNRYVKLNSTGRFPANLILECTCDEVKEGKEFVSGSFPEQRGETAFFGLNKLHRHRVGQVKDKAKIHTDPNCPRYMLDKQSGVSKSSGGRIGKKDKSNIDFGLSGNYKKGDPGLGDKGGASRFFKQIPNGSLRFQYVPKASKKERNKGLEDFEEKVDCDRNPELDSADVPMNRSANPKTNRHPTVKPLSLLRYLVRLVTQKGGIVLDPFLGSGTTAIACKLEGMNYIGIEKEPEYIKIAEARIKAWKPDSQEKLT